MTRALLVINFYSNTNRLTLDFINMSYICKFLYSVHIGVTKCQKTVL